jgi:ribosomal protein S18 acetylase RimI-like enzyme
VYVVHSQRQSSKSGVSPDSSRFSVKRAGVEDLELVVPLFDAYRQFYRQKPDLELARAFLSERFRNRESMVFVALDSDGKALGFTQLYPSFSSAIARRIFVLNDLFVANDARRSGVGRALLQAALEFGRAEGAARLQLATELDNGTAQALYAIARWQRDKMFCTYTFPLD